jgi:hypothetical protein
MCRTDLIQPQWSPAPGAATAAPYSDNQPHKSKSSTPLLTFSHAHRLHPVAEGRCCLVLSLLHNTHNHPKQQQDTLLSQAHCLHPVLSQQSQRTAAWCCRCCTMPTQPTTQQQHTPAHTLTGSSPAPHLLPTVAGRCCLVLLQSRL